MGGDEHGSVGVNRIGGKKQKKGRCFGATKKGTTALIRTVRQEIRYATNVNVLDILLLCVRPKTKDALRINSVAGGFKPKHKGRVQAVDEDKSGDAYAFTVKDSDKEESK